GPIRRSPVLILGDEPRVAVPIARSLHRRRVPVDVASLSDHAPELASRAIRFQHRLPSSPHEPHPPRGAFADLVREFGYDMAIPTSDTALCLVSGAYEWLSDLLHVACPAPHIVRRVLDKDVTLATARGLGILVPTTHLVDDLAALYALRDRLRFPLLAKDRSKTALHKSTFKVRYFADFGELERAFLDDPSLGSRTVLQEYYPGEDIGLGVLMHRGEMVAGCQYRSIKDLPYAGGVTVLAVSEPIDPAIQRGAMELLRALEWEGIALVEYRRDPATGRAALLEVNGRYWGSASLAIRRRRPAAIRVAAGPRGALDVPPSCSVDDVRWTAGHLRRLHGLCSDPVPEGIPTPRGGRSWSIFRGPSPTVVSAGTPDPAPALREVSHDRRADCHRYQAGPRAIDPEAAETPGLRGGSAHGEDGDRACPVSRRLHAVGWMATVRAGGGGGTADKSPRARISGRAGQNLRDLGYLECRPREGVARSADREASPPAAFLEYVASGRCLPEPTAFWAGV
ncbi:MAG: hypothetical protein WKF75_15005, partial [Singulisphaera sp.]